MSELYASMLLIGVTLSVGSFVTVAAAGTFSQGEGQVSLGSSLAGRRSGTMVSLVYFAVQPSGSCPLHGGYEEGTSAEVAVYDYGSAGFDPSQIAINSTAYPGPYSPVPAGGLAVYDVALGGCAHPAGQTVLLTDSAGDGYQFES